jgi:hypothetical protein
MKVAILGGLISPKETTMFEQLFTRQAAIARHQSLPFATERQLYLEQLVAEGRSRKTVRNIAHLLVVVVRHLQLDRSEITLDEIEDCAAAWARTAHRSARCLHVGERQFVYHATGLLRLLGGRRLPMPHGWEPFFIFSGMSGVFRRVLFTTTRCALGSS